MLLLKFVLNQMNFMASLNPDTEPEETMFNLTSKTLRASQMGRKLAGSYPSSVGQSRGHGGNVSSKLSGSRKKDLLGMSTHSLRTPSATTMTGRLSPRNSGNGAASKVNMRVVNIPDMSSSQELQPNYGDQLNIAQKWSKHTQKNFSSMLSLGQELSLPVGHRTRSFSTSTPNVCFTISFLSLPFIFFTITFLCKPTHVFSISIACPSQNVC